MAPAEPEGGAIKVFEKKSSSSKAVSGNPPATPTSLTAVSGPNTGQITLDWNGAVDSNINYQIEWWAIDYNSGNDYNGLFWADSTSIVHTTPTPPAQALIHYYKVKACNLFECSNWSNTTSVYPELGADVYGPYFALTEQSIMLNGDALYPAPTPLFTWIIDSNSGGDTNSSCVPVTSNLQNPIITCSSAGTFNVLLQVTAQNTAFDYTTITVTDSNVAPGGGRCPYYDKRVGQWMPCTPS